MSCPNGGFPFPAPNFFHINGRLEVVPHPAQETAQTRVQIACLEPTPDLDHESVNPNVEISSRNKLRKLNSKSSQGRKLTSKVWDDFTKYKDKEGNDRARCKHCKNDFDGSSINGTRHLKNHLASCQSRKSNDGEGDKQADHEKGNLTNPVVHQDKFVINQELNELGAVRAIIKYGFSKLNCIKPDILRVYQEEKEKFRRYLTKLSCRFSLTAESVDWMAFVLVLHFINDHWELKQKVITFHHRVADDSLAENVKKSLLDLYVDKNIFSVVNNVDLKDYQKEITTWLTERGSLPFCGHLSPASDLETFLQCTILRGTKRTNGRISGCLTYANKASNQHNLLTAVENSKSTGKKATCRPLTIPCGLEQLEAAVWFKEAFYELEQIDSDFKPINLTKEEWDDAEAMYRFVKELHDAACSLSANKYHTANVFFPKICRIYWKLLESKRSGNQHVREIASSAAEIFFDNYWCNYKLVLATAAFLDPRFKMDIIKHWYSKIYMEFADEHFKKIFECVTNVYREYLNAPSEILDEFGMPITVSETPDLDLYLKDEKMLSVQEFDVLNWWRSNASRYPTLAKMARDFLAVPISSSVSSDFSCDSTELANIIECDGLDDDLRSALIRTKLWMASSENN